jgi:four helix bundle protein
MNYKDLDVWKESKKLVVGIYKLTADFPDNEKYGITNQMRRAAVSVPSNIAEGNGRQYKKETIQFLYISKASLFELETQSIVAYELEMLSEEKLNRIVAQISLCIRLIVGLIKYYEKRDDLK